MGNVAIWATCLTASLGLAQSKGRSPLEEAFDASVSSNYAVMARVDLGAITNDLAASILAPTQDPAKAVAILRVIREHQLVGAKDELQRLLTELDRQNVQSPYKKFNPAAVLRYEIEKTIRLLEMSEKGLATPQSMAGYLLNIIATKVESGEVCNAELTLIREHATEITPQLLAVLDQDSKPAMKQMVLLALSASTSPTLEGEILSRMDKHRTHVELYLRMLALLGRIGGIESVHCLSKLVRADDQTIRAVAISSLSQMSQNTTDPKARTAAGEILKAAEQ